MKLWVEAVLSFKKKKKKKKKKGQKKKKKKKKKRAIHTLQLRIYTLQQILL